MATDPLTVDFNQSPFRRGMTPTPAGALPLRKRTNRGMVSLAAWDAKVAADNATNGTSSDSAPGAGVTLVQLLDTKQSEQALAEIAGKPLEPEAPFNPVLPVATTVPIPAALPTPRPPRATDPDDDDAVEIPTGGAPRPAMSRDALMEDSQSTRTNPVITLPPPDPEAVSAAKAALALEEAAAKAEQPGQPETPAAAIVAPTSTPPEPQAPPQAEPQTAPFIPPPPSARKQGNRR